MTPTLSQTATPVHCLSLDALSLTRCDDGVLLGQLVIAGILFQVEAIEVESDAASHATNWAYQDRLNAIKDFDGGHGIDYQTVEISGRPHFLVIFPSQVKSPSPTVFHLRPIASHA